MNIRSSRLLPSFLLQKAKNAKISIEKNSSTKSAPGGNRYDNVRSSSASEEVAYLSSKGGFDSNGENSENGAGVRINLPSSQGRNGELNHDLQMDPMTSTLMTSQVILTVLFISLRIIVNFSKIIVSSDALS